ncbi:MAG: glycosyltransferase family 39 protein [Nitrospinae bacterium]|jgi:4-amino-4-deoxy-L-arabinose transferase-like glycosyltransferase|nr:glycosyltransferase family 39 protein [Nitrospinota bacterium]MDA1108762.1 glycosyltransferase family 39 protein [Nitrospinota bacterium]
MKEKTIFNVLKPDSHAKVLLYIFLVALAFRLWGVTNPLLDFHSWRQTLTATIAQNFYLEEMNLLQPATNWVHEYYEFEFQVYPYLVALLYKIFGFHDILGRVVSIAFSLGTVGMLYLLGKRYYDPATGLVAAAIFSILPMSVFYTRAFMPESAMLFFSVAMLYSFTRWLDTGTWRDFFLASLFTTLTFLIKLPTLYMGGPLLFLAWLKFGKTIFAQYKLYLFVLLILAPPLLWYSHMADLHAQAHQGESIWLGNDKLANQGILFDYKFYKLIFWTRLVEKMFAFTAFPFLVLGMLSKTERKEQYLFHVWFFSVCAYFLIVAVGNQVHEYYQLPIIPVGSVFVGIFLAKFFKAHPNPGAWKRDIKVGLVLLMIVFIPIHSIYKLNKRLNFNRDYMTIGEVIKENSGENDRILLQDVGANRPQTFYYSDRKGWTLGYRQNLSPKDIDQYIANGAAYYAMAKIDLETVNKELFDYLSTAHQLVTRDSQLTLFKLNRPTSSYQSP